MADLKVVVCGDSCLPKWSNELAGPIAGELREGSTVLRNSSHNKLLESRLSVSVFFATYNEVENIPLAVALAVDTLNEHFNNSDEPLYEILICDDNSTDGTAETLTRLANDTFSDVPMLVLNRRCKLGLGSAYRDLFELSRGSRIVILDADLQHNPREIHPMLVKYDSLGLDMVVASRYVSGGGWVGSETERVFRSVLVSFIMTEYFLFKVRDPTGSYRVYRRSLLEWILNSVRSEGFAFQLESMSAVSAVETPTRIMEHPVQFCERTLGSSKFDLERVMDLRLISILIMNLLSLVMRRMMNALYSFTVMIIALVVFNRKCETMLRRIYNKLSNEDKNLLTEDLMLGVLASTDGGGNGNFFETKDGCKVIWRSAFGLYLALKVDEDENELAIIDLTHVLVKLWTDQMGYLREQDFSYHFDHLSLMIDEIIVGGLMFELDRDLVSSVLDYKIDNGAIIPM